MKHELPPLPYDYDALAPYISKDTLITHHDKHHAAYVQNLNKLVIGTPFEGRELEEIVRKSNGTIFNNAGQLWNHNFYFRCLRAPVQNNLPSGELAEAIKKRWKSFENFQSEFNKLSLAFFGSGWTWLVLTPDHNLEILGTSNAATPITTDAKPLLTCDVWEHAYYIDHKNVRGDYLTSFWHLINWDFVSQNMTS